MFLSETLNKVHLYDNWVRPSKEVMTADFTEYRKKEQTKWKDRAKQMGFRFPIFTSFEEYENDVKAGKVVTLSHESHLNIHNVSDCSNIEDIKAMVSTYVRPRDVDKIEVGFKTNHKIPYPVLLEGANGIFIMSGNTRLNVAKVLNIKLKAILINVSDRR